MKAKRFHGSGSIDEIHTDAIKLDIRHEQGQRWLTLSLARLRGCLQHSKFGYDPGHQVAYQRKDFFSTSRLPSIKYRVGLHETVPGERSAHTPPFFS